MKVFNQRYTVLENTLCICKCGVVFVAVVVVLVVFWTEAVLLNLCNFNIAENVSIVGTAF